MRAALVERFTAPLVVLAAMAGYVAWQMLVRAAGMSAATAWTIAWIIAFGGIAGIVVQLVWPSVLRRAPIHAAAWRDAAAVELPALPSTKRPDGWRFEEPPRVVLDPAIVHLGAMLKPDLERALVEILENPLANAPAVIGSEVVRIKRVHPTADAQADIPPLLLAYRTVDRERTIRKLALGPAEPVPAIDDSTADALNRVVETVAMHVHNGSVSARMIEN